MSLVEKAPVFYYDNFLSLKEADKLFEELSNINIVKHNHNGRKLGRATAVFGNNVDKVPPEIWGDNVKIMSWTPVMKSILDKVNDKVNSNNEKFNVCLVNSYDNGKDYIGWHADNEEKGSTYCIASISLGAVRKFSFLYRNKELGGEPERISVDLGHGSLLLMKHPCQDKYLHALLSDKKIKTKRINLTFRNFHYT